MKYLAFKESVAQQASAFICNYAIANSVKITVEHIAPHVVELPEEIDEAAMSIILVIAEKFDGYLTAEMPSPIDFFDPQPLPLKKVKMAIPDYDYDAAALYTQTRALIASGPGNKARSRWAIPSATNCRMN